MVFRLCFVVKLFSDEKNKILRRIIFIANCALFCSDVHDGISFEHHLHCMGLDVMSESLNGKDKWKADLFDGRIS